jgi:phosphohistidine phosphatase SixA
MDKGQILLMRHAEKADDPLNPNLSPVGRDRAQRLAQYVPGKVRQARFLFASAASKHSVRPIQTLQPLSEKIGVQIDSTFADQDYEALAHKILNDPSYDGKLVVICWHHGNIPPLAHELKAKSGDYPNPWDPKVFNLMLQFDYAHGILNVHCVIESF